MQTLVLGTSDAQRSFEEVVRGFGAGELRVLESDGSLRGYFSPAPPIDHEQYARFAELFAGDAGELLQRVKTSRSSITTAELLRQLNELAPAKDE